MNTRFALASATTPIRLGLRAIGSVGAVLAFITLGASILLRLTTTFGGDGTALSTLPSHLEAAIRLVHRLAAASLGLLALLAAILCWALRDQASRAVQPTVWMVASTLLLAVIGPLTPGYRYHAVTVANVVAGTVLLVSCWWLSVTLRPAVQARNSVPPLVRGTLALLVVHIGLGAAASAFEARGTHWISLVHSGTAMLTTMLLASLAWERRGFALLRKSVYVAMGLLVVQLVLGLSALLVEGRPVWLGFVHAMVSPLLAGALVSIAATDT